MKNSNVLLVLALLGFFGLIVFFLGEIPSSNMGNSNQSGGRIDKLLDEAEKAYLKVTPSQLSVRNVRGTLPALSDEARSIPQWGSMKEKGVIASNTIAGKPAEGRGKKAAQQKKTKKKSALRRVIVNPYKAVKSSPPNRFEESEIIGGGFSGTAPSTEISKKPNLTQPKTLEDWLALILESPNFTNVTKLISAFQEHKIDESVFYGVIDKMLESKTEEQREYAVIALVNVVSLESFTRLVRLKNTQRSGEIATLIESGLPPYTQPSQYSTLVRALQSNDPAVRGETVVIIKQIADNASTRPPTADNSRRFDRLGRGTGSTPSLSSNSSLGELQVLAGGLQSVLSRETNRAIAQLANSALLSFHALLKRDAQVARN